MKPEYFYVQSIMWEKMHDSPNSVEVIANHIVSRIDKNSAVILDLAWEAFYQFDIWEERYYYLISEVSKKTNQIFLITDENISHEEERLSVNGLVKVLSIDYFLYRTYKQLVILNHTDYNNQWNYNSNQFLLLFGRYKRHRAFLVEKIIDKGLLHNALYSLPWHSNDRPEVKRDADICLVDAFDKASPHVKFLDNYKDPFNGMMYDVNWFKDSLFRVIVETAHPSTPVSLKTLKYRIAYETKNQIVIDPEIPKFITEKTWITIVNHQPFLVYNENGVLDKIKNYGFNDFTKYLKHPSYNNEPFYTMIEQLTENTEYWLDHIHEFADDINRDVIENFQILEKVFNDNENKIIKFMQDNDLGDDIEYVVNTDFNQYNMAWEVFYNNIKDDSWPHSTLIKDFHILPERIKKECMDDILGDSNNWVLQLWAERYNITV